MGNQESLINPSINTIRFIHISDTHSLTSHIRNVPDGDVLLITGDITSRKYANQTEQVIEFNNWLGTLPHKYKIVIAGNNDVVFDTNYDKENSSADVMKAMLTNAIYLQDSSTEV